MIFNDKNSILLSKRLKELREEKKLSHEKLCEQLQQAGVKVGLQSLKNFEVTEKRHSKFEAAKGMKAETLFNLAEFYGVSVDYLLGRTEIKSIDNKVQAACEVTGLNEEAINNLVYLKNIINGTKLTKETEKIINRNEEKKKNTQNELNQLFNIHNNLKDDLKVFIKKEHQIVYDNSLSEEKKLLNEAYVLYLTIQNIIEENSSRKEDEKIKGQQYIEAVNKIISSNRFFEFIDDLSLYLSADFIKKSKKIFSLFYDNANDHEKVFIFDSSIIEQGLLVRIQQFFSTLKNNSTSNYYLTDIEENYETEEDSENAQHNPKKE